MAPYGILKLTTNGTYECQPKEQVPNNPDFLQALKVVMLALLSCSYLASKPNEPIKNANTSDVFDAIEVIYTTSIKSNMGLTALNTSKSAASTLTFLKHKIDKQTVSDLTILGLKKELVKYRDRPDCTPAPIDQNNATTIKLILLIIMSTAHLSSSVEYDSLKLTSFASKYADLAGAVEKIYIQMNNTSTKSGGRKAKKNK
jgi:hypothetical protein